MTPTAILTFVILAALLAVIAIVLVIGTWLRPTRGIAKTIHLSARNLGRQNRPTIDQNANRNLYGGVRRRNP
ncbi:MAG: hypothetical protein ABWY00_11605 [Dongiaceae bacterium]